MLTVSEYLETEARRWLADWKEADAEIIPYLQVTGLALRAHLDRLTDPPDALLKEIDAVNARVYDSINNGVYKAGFATAQDVYEQEVRQLFDSLDELEALLGRQAYLVGNQVTEADWRLFTTLIRFDAVYHGHFKCNLKRLVDHPNLWSYTRELYQMPGVADTIHFDHIKQHYYRSHHTINPNGIVPLGPVLDLDHPPSRNLQGAGAL